MSVDIGTKILLTLYSLGSVLKLYEVNNSAVVRQIDVLDSSLKEFFTAGEEQLKLTLRSDEFFVNDKLFKVDLQLYIRMRELAKSLGEFDYGDLRFSAATTRVDIENFVLGYSDSLRASKSMLKPQYGGISGKKAVGSSAAAFRFEPNKMAIWLYAGLLDVVEQLYVVCQEGKTPSLLPLRRSLQMIIDNMKQHSGIYQMLSAIRDLNKKRSLSNTRVAIAIDAIGLGIFLDFSSLVLMDLALCGILGGLSESDSAVDSVTPLFQFSGLGASAVGLILTLHDARAARQGQNAGVLGNVLMIVEAYHHLLNEHLDTPLPELIRLMATGGVEGLDKGLAQLFARYKGLYPIGSLLLIDGANALVMGHSNNEVGKKRPIVAKIRRGRLIPDLIDLSRRKDLDIQKVLSSKKEKINIAQL